MKTKNNLTTGILIGISVVVLPLILMSSSTSSSNNGVVYSTPESHVWESDIETGGEGRFYLYNKKTGEVRKYSKTYPAGKTKKGSSYVTMKPETY